MLEKNISEIQNGIRIGQYLNEASVITGIVFRVLNILDWPIYDTQIVIPEYPLDGRRVDIALCHPKNKPLVFIEVKQIGKIEGADKQLFEYAFHSGVPMAIVTDGQEWHFYLPAEQGKYQERRVYKLDLLERDVKEISSRFKRYLKYESLCSGKAIELARQDYKNIHKEREIRTSVPVAWNKLIEEHDDLLVEILADKVESICGYKPDPEIIADFFDSLHSPNEIIPENVPSKKDKKPDAQDLKQKYSVLFKEKNYVCKNAIDVLRKVFELFQYANPSFHERFVAIPKHGKKRRYLSRQKYELYPGRPDLADECSIQLKSGFWLGTNYSRADIRKIIILACNVFGCEFGRELIISLG